MFKNRSSKLLLAFIILPLTICYSGYSAAQQENQSTYSAFVSALTAMSVAANDLIQNERNVARFESIRQKLTYKVIAAFPGDAGKAPVTDPNNTLSLAGVL